VTEIQSGNVYSMILPDQGMTEAEINTLADSNAAQARAYVQAAIKQGRFDMRTYDILPLSQAAQGQASASPQAPPAFGPATPIGGSSGGGYGGGGAAPPGAAAGVPPNTFNGEKYRIPWSAGNRLQATDLAGVALATRSSRLFLRGSLLAILDNPRVDGVSKGFQPAPEEGVERPDEPPPTKSVAYTDTNLRRARLATAKRLSRQVDEGYIQFISRRKNRDGKSTMDIDIVPPDHVLQTLIDEPALCPARPLVAIANVPYMDKHGRLDARPGYHEDTGIFHDTGSLPPLNIPDKPTDAEAFGAVAVLIEPFRYYDNFRADKMRWSGEVLTLLLSSVNRAFLPTMPILMINGNAFGVGKGELCKSCSYLAYGVRGDFVTRGGDDKEFDKRIDAILIEGAPVVIFDNLNNYIMNNENIASMATEATGLIRRYGRNDENIPVGGRSLYLFNGNGILPSRDNVRRSFVVDLTTKSANPPMRKFPFKPSMKVRDTRVAMLEAVFTLMRWHRQQGMTWRAGPACADGRASRTPLGSFEQWSIEVGNLVQRLTGWHPNDSIERNINRDPDNNQAGNAINALATLFGTLRKFRAGDIANICARVEKTQRDGGVHVVATNFIVRGMHPTLVAAEHTHKQRQTAYDQYGRTGKWPVVAGLTLAQVRDNLKADLDRALADVSLETALACGRQAPIEEELTEAMKAVTRQGRLDSVSIARWLGAVKGTVINGKCVVMEEDLPGAQRTKRVNEYWIETV
jgi:hypothetical protein